MSEAVVLWVLAICSWIVVGLLILEMKKRKQINQWARESLKAIEFRQQLVKAEQSGLITDWAKAAEVDLHDPMFADLSVDDFTDVIQVRLADRLKRIKGEQK